MTVPHIFYYFDEIDLEEMMEKRLNGRAVLVKYHDERSLIRKLK